MLPTKIEELLNSQNEDDNAVGWELVDSQKIPLADVKDYLERTKRATNWAYKYHFDGSRFVRNDYFENEFDLKQEY